MSLDNIVNHIMKRPTIKQKLAFKNLLVVLRNGDPFSLKQIMREAGYKEATAINPEANLTSKMGWKQLMAKIDDEEILGRINEILRDTDKRSSLTAADMLLKLRDRYPDKKVKINAFDEREEVIE